MMLLHISQSKSRGISYLNARRRCRSWTITQKSTTAWMSKQQHLTTNDRLRGRFVSFIRVAERRKINSLNGPSNMHENWTWLSQSLQWKVHVFCWVGMPKNLPWKCFRTALRHYVSVKSKLQHAPPGHTPGIWHLCRPGEEGIWLSVFQGVGNLNCTLDFM